jgi:hypothetical protein
VKRPVVGKSIPKTVWIWRYFNITLLCCSFFS